MKPMPREEEARVWMRLHAGEHLYRAHLAEGMPHEVDSTALFEAFLAHIGDHGRPPNDEDHPAFWIAVEVAVEWEDARAILAVGGSQ